MKTRKAISTVSYLSEEFLAMKLAESLERGDLCFYSFIKHEADQDFLKDHYHVYAEPLKQIDTEVFNKRFVEFDPTNEKPLKCLSWRPSKFDDWFLYCLHDPEYLKFKGLKRNKHYSETDFWFSDLDEWDYRKSMVNYSIIGNINEIIESAENLIPLSEAIEKNIIPHYKMNLYLNIFRAVKSDKLSRIKNEKEGII